MKGTMHTTADRTRTGREGRTRRLAVLLFLASLVLGGCGDRNDDAGAARGDSPSGTGSDDWPGGGTPTPADASAGSPLSSTDWTRVLDHLDCLDAGNEGIEVLNTQFADVRGTGVPDAFVTFRCIYRASTWPSQVEVFDGSSSPDNPKRIAVLVDVDEKMNGRNLLASSDLSFSGGVVTVKLAAYQADDAMCCPSERLIRTFTWDGTQLGRQPDKLVSGSGHVSDG